MSAELLDASFLRELEALRRRLEIRARAGAVGERATRRRGSSAEFEDHRPYAPGDDPRRIDWAAYARSGEPVLKQFRAEEDAIARLLVDTSASMRFGAPAKVDVARRLAAAIGYMALSKLERAQVLSHREGRLWADTPRRGRGALGGLLRALDGLEASGAQSLSSLVDGALQQSRRVGMLVVASDFLDAGPLLTSLSRARGAGHDLVLLQVVAPEEESPVVEGDIVLEDAETGALVELTADAEAIEAYAMRFAGLCEELRSFARRNGASYVRARTDEPLLDAVRRVVAREID